ncbi:MAG: T9SS type A sorting domain-containing protein, partial [Chitinophagales bacterium]
YCNNDNPVLFNANLSGGNFFVDDVEVLQFEPTSLSTGIHTVRYEYESSTEGCNGSIEELVAIVEAPVANFTASNTLVVFDEEVILVAKEQENVSYTWYVDGVAVSTDLIYIFSASNADTYSISLEVTASNGCSDISDPLMVIVGIVDIEDHGLLSSLQISPNPASDFLQLSFNTTTPKVSNLQWYNAQGQLMEAKNLRIEANGWSYKMDVSHFAAGVYYLHLQTGETSVVEKVLILR